MTHGGRRLTPPHTNDTRVISCQKYPLHRTLHFTYAHQTIISTHRIDTIHCSKRLLARSWPATQLTWMQSVNARKFVALMTWKCVMVTANFMLIKHLYIREIYLISHAEVFLMLSAEMWRRLMQCILKDIKAILCVSPGRGSVECDSAFVGSFFSYWSILQPWFSWAFGIWKLCIGRD
jgi:hypothetical protein